MTLLLWPVQPCPVPATQVRPLIDLLNEGMELNREGMSNCQPGENCSPFITPAAASSRKSYTGIAYQVPQAIAAAVPDFDE